MKQLLKSRGIIGKRLQRIKEGNNVQSKKKDIQMGIQTTALEMFYSKGYHKTKMSDIAKEMEMSVGNIYTYFKNKHDLFYTVVPENTILYFEEVILTAIQAYNDFLVNQKESEEVFELIEKQLKLMTNNYREVVIMLEKNEGTIYEGTEDKLINIMVEDRIQKERHFQTVKSLSEDDLGRFYRIIGHGFLSMVLMVLKEELDLEEKYQLAMSLIVYELKKR